MEKIFDYIIDLAPAIYIASMIIVTLAASIDLYLKIKDGVMFSSRLYRMHIMGAIIPIFNTLIALLIIMNVIDYVLYEIERFLRRIIK